MDNTILTYRKQTMLTLMIDSESIIIDDCNLKLFLFNKWNLTQKTDSGIIYCISSQLGLFHRQVINASPFDIVDHKNGNGLDNRLENLRLVSNRFNSQNTYLRREEKTLSKYIGVTKSKTRWRARHWTKESGHISIGSYSTQEQAARAYDNYVITNIPKADWGMLNFIGDSII